MHITECSSLINMLILKQCILERIYIHGVCAIFPHEACRQFFCLFFLALTPCYVLDD